MTFRFRGARILEWRRVQADAARVAFVRATESVREAAARVADADDQSERAAREYRTAMASSHDIGTIVGYRNWIGNSESTRPCAGGSTKNDVWWLTRQRACFRRPCVT